jgi:hypothetical protein
MNRRGFFATMLAPLVARFAPKPKFNSGVAIARASRDHLVTPTTLTWDMSTGIYTRHVYGPDGKKILIERRTFDRLPFSKV